MAHYVNTALLSFSDRFAAPKWIGRCRITGLEHIRAAQKSGRPIIIAFCHFGPCFRQRYWLCAAGIPVAALAGGKAKGPIRRQVYDPRPPFPELRLRFYEDELRAAVEFLATGNPLMIAVDHPTGKLMNLAAGDGWNFQMATVAMRLAIRPQAELIPCFIADEGSWRYRLEICPPVPSE